MKGYVKLRRGIAEHFKVMSASELKVYVGLLLLANYKNGSVNTTIAKLSDFIALSYKWTQVSLHRLEAFGYVKITVATNQWKDNKIEIINYNGSVITSDPTSEPRSEPRSEPHTTAKSVSSNNSNDLSNPKNYKEVLRIKKNTGFNTIWSKYPNKVGKKAALRHYQASVKSESDIDLINKALENYLKSERVAKGYIQNASTWFNDWKTWVEYKEDLCSKCKGSGIWTSLTGYENTCSCPAGVRRKAK